MSSMPITSVFNDGYVAEQFDAYRRDPASVDESWRQFFQFAERIAGTEAGTPSSADPDYLRIVAASAALVQGIRNYGHLAVPLDPLGTAPPGAPELTPEFYGITEADLARVPGAAIGFDDRETAADVVRRLREVYSSRLGYEVWHLQEAEEREWFRQQFRTGELLRPLTADEKKLVLRRITEVDGLERFIGRAYVGAKRFSIEGTDVLVPMLDAAIAEAAMAGAREVVMAMAHRGRINVLVNILGKPAAAIFREFEGLHAAGNAVSGTGDVKYHLGFEGSREIGGRRVSLTLVPNPSHLEVVDAVVTGVTRAHQRIDAGGVVEGPPARDEAGVVPVLVHGDAAFPGEGVVAETFNMSRLRGYRVGGTLHVIANNQVGFTTNPIDARSTHYASDLAKGFDVPIVHVNADDAEACIQAVRLAVAYRARFAKDFVIDVVGYRRFGHNEGDEPTFTQPELYARVKAHKTPREVWAERLVAEGVIGAADATQLEQEAAQRFADVHAGVERTVKPQESEPAAPEPAPEVDTRVPAATLVAQNEALLQYPPDFTPHQRLAKQLERRRETMGEAGGIEWGQAESLAYASLLAEGVSVRISGQDVERGTFSHRHAVLHDGQTGQTYTPLQHVPGASGAFEIYNSPLSETAVLGFEYGHSVATPDTLTIWEAQFGDFVNVAQPVIDQFIVADRAKWGQDSSLVMLLPHGYEGQGPEHSSARLERFLQSVAEGNLRVAYPTSAAQIFHLLRRQARTTPRRPLVVMSPKSLLRLPQAAASLTELAEGAFQPVIDDASAQPEAVRRVVLCTGKVFYDLTKDARPAHVAVVRVEELAPWPADRLRAVLDRYPKATEVVWVQEEPNNMGAWTYAEPKLRQLLGGGAAPRYIGRPERASPAEGYTGNHQVEQARIVAEALAVPDSASEAPAGRRKKAAQLQD
ncbi:MAG TPA: 2-oxoglutarate dehydrogenase E1 component [Gemmatimonadaceae bacterium]|jgi:2-oxoglutarate dehydrogenase E1 component|nr:2-oxoglutarate dehydrogenase E1 component [Gemmatimonadaceae bacterium]